MFPRLLETLARKLAELEIPYMVIGGQAVLLYGEPRLTRDINITLGINSDEVGRVVELARQLGLTVLTGEPEAFARRTIVLPARDPASGLQVDFIFSFSPYERQAIERAVTVKVETTGVKFAALEDLLIHKFIAGRPRDLEDVRAILVRRPKYDEQYVRNWLAEFDRALASNCVATFDSVLRDSRQEPKSI